MVDGIVYLASVVIAAVCGAIWGLWRGEKSNIWLRQKNQALNQALESERKANEILREQNEKLKEQNEYLRADCAYYRGSFYAAVGTKEE